MSLQIQKTAGSTTTLALSGRLDTTTAPELEAALADAASAKELVLDMNELAYISSAGLRVILKAQKTMLGVGGTMKLTHVSETVQEVFDITGFSDFLTIEK